MTPKTLTQITALLVQVLGSFGAADAVQPHLGHLAWLGWLIAAINSVLAIGHALAPSLIPAPIASIPDSAKKAAGLLLLGLLLIPATLKAQTIGTPAIQAQVAPTPIPTSQGLSAESDAMAVHFNGEWSAGTLVTESFDFLDFGAAKGNHLFLTGQQFLAPTPGVQAYLGGITIQPDFTPLFKKTNVPTGNFAVFVSGAVGNGIPSVGGSHISFLAGGGVKYSVTSNLTWQTIQGYYGRIGSQPFEAISTGLSFIFGRPGH